MTPNPERELLDKLAMDIGTSLENAIGGRVEVGVTNTWKDEDVRERAIPLRVAIVEFGEPLDDCILVMSNHREDQLRTIAAAAGLAISQSLEANADVGMPTVHEFQDRDDAMTQLDALYNEPALHFVCGHGDVVMMIGSPLVAAAMRVAAGGSPVTAEDEELLELAGAFDFDSPAAGTAAAPDTSGGNAIDVSSQIGPGGDGVDALLDANIDLDGDVAYGDNGPIGGEFGTAAHVATAEANANAAANSPVADRWASLITGVDVELSAELGSTAMCLGDITSLSSESVLTLDQHIDSPLTVFVNGSPYATARLVVVGDEYGIEIIEVLADGADVATRALAA